MQLFSVPTNSGTPLLLTEEDGKLVPLPDSFWKRQVHHYDLLTSAGQQKCRRKYLKSADVTALRPPNPDLPPAWRKIRDGSRKRQPTEEDFRCAAQALLSLPDVFPQPEAGAMLLATALMGLRAVDLTRQEPTLRPCMALRGSPQLEKAMKRLFKAILPQKRWNSKRSTVKRRRVADLADGQLRLVDISRFRVQAGEFKSVWLPLPPENTVLLVLHGRDGSWGQLSGGLSQVGLLFVNSTLSANGWGPASVPTYSIEARDELLLEDILRHAPQAACLLGLWWSRSTAGWAQEIVRRTHNVLGRPDSRFRTFSYDAKALCRAAACQVLLDFVAFADEHRLLTPDEAAAHRRCLTEIFTPTPPPPPAIPRRAEDASVYLDKLKAIIREQPQLIIPEGQLYLSPRRGGFAAAWRKISGQTYLVVEESVWAAWYAKAIKADSTIDAAFLQRPKWVMELQKELGAAGVLKMPAAGCRYRYDLQGNGTRDSTFVVATPRSLLTEEIGQGAGQDVQPPANRLAGHFAESESSNGDILEFKGDINI